MIPKPSFTPAKRKRITRNELRLVVAKQMITYGHVKLSLRLATGTLQPIHEMTWEQCRVWLSENGTCYLSEQRINGQPFDFEHVIPNALRDEHTPAKWDIALRDAHAEKTKQDITNIAKAKRVARKSGVDRESNPMPEKRGNRKIQSQNTFQGQGFGKKPDGYKHQWGNRGFGT